MEKKIIDLNKTNMVFGDIDSLNNYVWKNDKLMPVAGDE
nr:MAG TPA: hypothetical protein [Bacteriophage sp.]